MTGEGNACCWERSSMPPPTEAVARGRLGCTEWHTPFLQHRWQGFEPRNQSQTQPMPQSSHRVPTRFGRRGPVAVRPAHTGGPEPHTHDLSWGAPSCSARQRLDTRACSTCAKSPDRASARSQPLRASPHNSQQLPRQLTTAHRDRCRPISVDAPLHPSSNTRVKPMGAQHTSAWENGMPGCARLTGGRRRG